MENDQQPQENLVNVVEPGGDLVSVPQSQAQDAVENHGYTQATQDDVDHYVKQQKYGSVGQQAITGLEGIGEGLAGPVFTAAERAFHVPGEDILGRKEINPGTHTITQVGGLGLGTMIPGLGEYSAGNALEKVGAGAAELAGLGGEGASAISNIGASAVKGSAEMMALQAGDETSKMIAGDPNQSVDTAAANVGLAGLLGLGGGAAIGTVSPLWKAVSGGKYGQFIEDLKGELKSGIDNPDPAGAMSDEIKNLSEQAKSASKMAYGENGLKDAEIQRLVQDVDPAAVDKQSDQMLSDVGDTLNKMKSDEYGRYSKASVNDFELQANKLADSLEGAQTPFEKFKAMEEFKQGVSQFGNYKGQLNSTDAAFPFIQEMRGVRKLVQTGLEDESVWGDAAGIQKDINSNFKKYKDFFELPGGVRTQFFNKTPEGYQLNTDKVTSFLNQVGKGKGELKQSALGKWIDSVKDLTGTINKIHDNIGVESPLQPISTPNLDKALKKLSPGARAGRALVERGLANMGGSAIGTAVGAGLGHLVGAGGIGAIVGEHALGPVFSSILPALTKPMLAMDASGSGLKAAIDYGMKVVKGEAAIAKSAQAVFGTNTSMPLRILPSAADRDKLDKKIQDYQNKPEDLLAVGGHVGHYLPDHNTAMGQTAVRAVQYLNSIKPKSVKLAPLDPELKPSQMQKTAYDRTLNIALQPLCVLDHLKKGTLIPNDVQDLTSMFPGLHNKLSQQLTNHMIDHVSKENTIPYQMRQSLSLFLGQNLDSSLSPQSIQATQAIFANNNAAKASANQSAPASKTKALAKAATPYMTSTQASEARRRA